jgi:uncharacterized protein YndB with AHSA1/START domain
VPLKAGRAAPIVRKNGKGLPDPPYQDSLRSTRPRQPTRTISATMAGMEQRTSIDVAASPGRVWEVLVDVERWPEWTDSVSSVRPLDAGPLAIGSRVEISQPRIPTGTYTVTALEPGRAFTWEQRRPGSTVSAHHECAPLPDGGTRVELRVVMSGAAGGSWDGCAESSPSGTSQWRRPASRPVRRASLAEAPRLNRQDPAARLHPMRAAVAWFQGTGGRFGQCERSSKTAARQCPVGGTDSGPCHLPSLVSNERRLPSEQPRAPGTTRRRSWRAQTPD